MGPVLANSSMLAAGVAGGGTRCKPPPISQSPKVQQHAVILYVLMCASVRVYNDPGKRGLHVFRYAVL